ncbi:hypothetical protein [Magnetofaba australis]|uniref:Uncharacterized protein n=1 Tax=Magnetofaba australis IT-1 TaxID=1434232 RepID=A0A1Y2K9N8_9PROT|nr:hypothetical protein [Magnetofaba australis]OSM07659.1 hypothetical protein MAIT1_04578 [Magnetofaba australis IT-1]
MGIPTLFEARGGISIGVAVLSGTGAPGGAGGHPDDAVKGSIYLDDSNGQMWLKKTAGTGADKWVRIQSQDDLDTALLGQSWREPVKLRDATSYADMTAAETAVNTGTIDGVAVADGDRILFEAITGENSNVFIVTGTPGSGAILVEDGNDASKGDALYIQDGTDAGKQYAFNGSSWVQQGSASSTEIGYLQSFIGKSGNGNEAPDYLSTHVVTDGDALEKAIGDLDAEIGGGIATPQTRTAGPISDQPVNLNLKALDDAIGPNVTSTHQVAAADSVNANISALDAAVGADVVTPQVRTTGAISAQAANLNIQSLDAAIGADVTSTHFVGAASSVNANISALDAVLADVKTESKTDSVTALATLDSVLVDEASVVEWTIHARSTVTGSKVWSGKVLAMHNGTTAADATDVDFNLFAILKMGGIINQLDFDVDLNGAGVSQTLRLRASSGEAVNITVTRSILNQL